MANERRLPVEVLQVTRECARCGEGSMLPTGIVLTSNPPQYPHRCDRCRAEETFAREYPCLEYVVKAEAVLQAGGRLRIWSEPGQELKAETPGG